MTILYGSSAGLHGTATAQGMAWRINAAAVVDDEDNETGFGLYLTTGYFDGDSYADLAIGYTSYESVHGGVAVLSCCPVDSASLVRKRGPTPLPASRAGSRNTRRASQASSRPETSTTTRTTTS